MAAYGYLGRLRPEVRYDVATSPPLGAYPCDSGVAFNRVLGAALRVKTWQLAIKYQVEQGHMQGGANGTFIPDGPAQPATVTVVSMQLNQTSTGAAGITKEQDLGPLNLSWNWQDQAQNTSLTVQVCYDPAKEQWLGRFQFSLGYFIDPQQSAELSGQNTDDANNYFGDPTAEILMFWQQQWQVLSGALAPGQVVSTSTGASRLTLLDLQLTPKEYWSYGGTYDTSTGALA